MRQSCTSHLSSWVRLVALSLLLGLGLLTGSLLMSKPAHARSLAGTTITDCADDSQLQSAVSSASSGDIITFGCSGDIPLSQTLVIATNLTLDGSGQNVTLDGQNNVQVLFVNPSVTFTLNSLIIVHGFTDSYGGGLDNEGGTVSISNSTFVSNAAGDAGGFFNNRGTVSISNSTFARNTAGDGAGFFNLGGTVNISNSTFANNTAASAGGGGFNEAATLNISNSTFANNLVSNNPLGGGILNFSGPVNISGSIFANGKGGNCYGGINDQDYNLSSDSSCGFTGTGSLQNTDPRLDPNGLQNNGGPTQTIALQQISPATDQIPASICPATDQRGMTRPDDSETTCDMGAYESNYKDSDLSLSNMPSNITTNATSPQGAVVTYPSPTVVDEDSPLPPVSCSPVSGSTFAVGTTAVTCTASDSDDTNSPVSGSFSVTVNPVLSVSVASVTATEGSAFSGVVATGTAYGGSNPLTATINWGDGNSSTVSVTPNADGSYSVPGSHTYAEEGSYTPSVTVKDSGSLSATGNGSAQVSDAALTLTHFVASSLNHRSAGVAATFTDADPAGTVSDYTATINWGDSTTSTVKVVKNPVGSGFVLAGLHSYAKAGTYSVTLTIVDQGGSQVSKTVTITVK